MPRRKSQKTTDNNTKRKRPSRKTAQPARYRVSSDSDEQPPDDSPVNPMPSTSTQPSCEQTPAITVEQFDRLLLRMEQMEKTMAESQGTQLIPEGVEPPQIPEHQPDQRTGPALGKEPGLQVHRNTPDNNLSSAVTVTANYLTQVRSICM